MPWTTLDPRTVGCKSAANNSFSATDVQRDSNGNIPNVAVCLTDSADAVYPTPTVQKSTTAGNLIYGKLVSWDPETYDVSVATGGIQSFTKSSAAVSGDIGKGIIPDTTNAGQVDTATAATDVARGTVVAYNGTTLFVDLEVSFKTQA